MDAIVLAGGRATRLGGMDKAALVVGGRTLLERVLDALHDFDRIVIVGKPRETPFPVEWTREEPAGGGPVAAIDAGLRHVKGEVVAVAAVDLPFLTAADVLALSAASSKHDGAIFVDAGGKDQSLAGVYRVERLRAAIRGLPSVSGTSMRALIRDLDLARIVNDRAAHDCDTIEDVERAQKALERR